MNKLDCNQCELRKQLCSRRLCIAAERYANQDYVGRRESPFTWVKNCNPDCIRTEHNAFLQSPPATILIISKLYFRHRLKISEIADITYKSHQYVSKIITTLCKLVGKNGREKR